MAPKPSTSTPATPRSANSTTSSQQAKASKSPTNASSSSSSQQIKNAQDAQQIVLGVWNNYVDRTPQRIKLLDIFMAFLVFVGVVQFIYVVIVGNYPFNAFLSGFSATVGQFVLTASLRIQTNPENSSEFKETSHERAFADYIFGSLILHFFCVNFIN